MPIDESDAALEHPFQAPGSSEAVTERQYQVPAQSRAQAAGMIVGWLPKLPTPKNRQKSKSPESQNRILVG